MGKLINDIDSAICNINSCLSSAGSGVIKSATYGRDEKEVSFNSKLSQLSLIKSRLERYKGTFLTDECWPATCSFDPCLQRVSVGCIDYVASNQFLDTGARYERWDFSQYNRSLGAMVSLSVADDDGSNPVTFSRFRFYKWDNCENKSIPISGYIDSVNSSDLGKFFYSEGRDEYFVIGDQWIMKLDSDFNVLESMSYGGNKNWQSMYWDDGNNEIYLPDRSNQAVDIVDMDDISIKSTTSLPSGVPVPGGGQVDPRDCVYKDGGLLVLGGNKAWHLNVSSLVATLVIDGDGTGSVKGTPVIDNDGVARCISYIIDTKRIEIDTWTLTSSSAFVTNSVDIDIESEFPISLVSLVLGIEFDNCNNMYFYNVDYVERSGTSVKVYDKNLKYQDLVPGIFVEGGAYWSFFNFSNNKLYYALQRSTSDNTVVVDIDKRDGNKVDKYPEMCSPWTEEDVCNIISTSKEICASLCK